MDRNLSSEWQTVPLPSAVGDNHVQRYLPAMKTVPDYTALFDMTLVLTVGFSLLELAVELPRTKSRNDAMAFVAATAMWTTLACSAEIFTRRFLLQFFPLFGDGFIAGILMPVSHITLTPLGIYVFTRSTLWASAPLSCWHF